MSDLRVVVLNIYQRLDVQLLLAVHVPLLYSRLSIGMCLDMCTDMRIDMCIDTNRYVRSAQCIDMHATICTQAHV